MTVVDGPNGTTGPTGVLDVVSGAVVDVVVSGVVVVVVVVVRGVVVVNSGSRVWTLVRGTHV